MFLTELVIRVSSEVTSLMALLVSSFSARRRWCIGARGSTRWRSPLESRDRPDLIRSDRSTRSIDLVRCHGWLLLSPTGAERPP